MPPILKGVLIVVLSTALGGLAALGINYAAGAVFESPLEPLIAVLIGACVGFLYGLEAGILLIYDLDKPAGWLQLVVDLTWSFPNTVFGFVLGNIFYPFFGSLSRDQSQGKSWIVYAKEGELHQTLGTINLGGKGQHERMHLLQARLFGPLYLPLYALFYAVTAVLQVTWTLTVGMALWLFKLRDTPYFRLPKESVVSGFFGWIYYATPFELWAYASGNPED